MSTEIKMSGAGSPVIKIEKGDQTSLFPNPSISKVESEVTSDARAKVIETPRKEYNKRYRRMQRTTYQARLGRKLDNIANKILDNGIRLSAHPTDMLRIEVERDERSRDLISRTIKSTEIMPIILPKMVDIPLRHLIRENTDVLIPSLYTTQNQQDFFEVYAPIECELNEDDLLVRILYDSTPDINEPYVFVLQVKEILGTFGYSSLMWKKCIVTYYDEALPARVVNIIKESIIKRELLDW